MNLQDFDKNLNPNFKGKIDLENDLYAFIDESGDEGFNFSKVGNSKWFNVSAIISKPSTITGMMNYIRNYRDNKFPQKPIERMSSKELKHGQRKDIFSGLSSFDFTTTHSLFYKPNIDPKDRLIVYPSMYFVGVKNVVERISWYSQQCGMRKTHILISNRNNIRSEDIGKYLFGASVAANKNLFYPNKIGFVKLSNISLRNQLLLADYTAFTLRMVFEEMGNPPSPEPYYFDMFQKGKLFSSKHQKWGGIWGNGLKLTPSDKNLIFGSSILDEGSHKP